MSDAATNAEASAGTKADESIETDWHNQLFGVKRTIRYYIHRRRFFEKWKLTTDFLIIVSGGLVVSLASSGEGARSWGVIAAGAMAAMLGTFDLLIGFSVKARESHDFVKEFGRLERDMTASPKTREALVAFTNRRLELEEEEPPRLRVLNNLCHNELIIAEGYPEDDYADIPTVLHLTAPYVNWGADAIRTRRQKAENVKASLTPKPPKRPSVLTDETPA